MSNAAKYVVGFVIVLILAFIAFKLGDSSSSQNYPSNTNTQPMHMMEDGSMMEGAQHMGH